MSGSIQLNLKCPYCGSKNESHEAINSRDVPEAGNASLCWDCLQVAFFEHAPGGEELWLRVMTDQEIDEQPVGLDALIVLAKLAKANGIGAEAFSRLIFEVFEGQE